MLKEQDKSEQYYFAYTHMNHKYKKSLSKERLNFLNFVVLYYQPVLLVVTAATVEPVVVVVPAVISL